MQDGGAKIALGEDALLTVSLPGVSEHALTGTLTSLYGGENDDGPALSDAVRLFQAIDCTAAH